MPQNSARVFRDYRKLRRLFESGEVFCAFDTETTGLSPSNDSIIEIGAVKFDKGGTISKFGSLVKIAFPLSPQIVRITGISDEMLSCAPGIEKVLADFREFSRGTILVAHNAMFDWNFVEQELARASLPRIKNKIIDTLAAARWAYPLNKGHSLQYLAAGMEIKAESAHRAYDDARVCMEVFLRILRDTDSIQI